MRERQASAGGARPRVAFIITGLNPGGAEHQLQEVVLRLPRSRWDVRCVIALIDTLGRKSIGDTPVRSLGMRRGIPDPIGVVRAVSILRSERPHLIISFMFHASFLGWLVRPFVGRPRLISSVRSERIGSPLRERVTALFGGLGDTVTVNSRLAAASMMKAGILPPEKTIVVPNGIAAPTVDSAGTRLAAREGLDVPKTSFIWLMVARLEKPKDHLTLLRALAAQKHSDSVLLLAGRGPREAALKNTARDLRIEHRVRFLGYRPDVEKLLVAADAFVLSSAWEGLPNAVMEAMAAGLPVVATAVGGVPELVVEGRTGCLVPANDVAALAEAMDSIEALRPEQRSRLGDEGNQYIIKHYTWASIVGQWEAVMSSTLSDPQNSTPSSPASQGQDQPTYGASVGNAENERQTGR